MMHEPNVVLTEEQINFFWTNGFLTVDQISSPEEIEIMRAKIQSRNIHRADGICASHPHGARAKSAGSQ